MATVGLVGGSSVLPHNILVGHRYVELNDVVIRAFTDSALAAVDWNALDQQDRDHRLVGAIYDLRAEVGITYDA